MNNLESQDLKTELQQFSGTIDFHRHSFFSHSTYTDGIQHLCEQANSYWLLDVIFSYLPDIIKDKDYFYVITLKKSEGNSFVFKIENEVTKLSIRQEIEYSDFPLDEITLYLAYNGEQLGYTVMLPSER